MIIKKTIKRKKQLRLDELIEYVRGKQLRSFQFVSNGGKDVYFSSNGLFEISGDAYGNSKSIKLDDTFPVEVEERLTEDTVFDTLVGVSRHEKVRVGENINIREYRDYTTKGIYAFIDGELVKIWEADVDEL